MVKLAVGGGIMLWIYTELRMIHKIIERLGIQDPKSSEKVLKSLSKVGDCNITPSKGHPYWLSQWPRESLRDISKNLKTILSLWTNHHLELTNRIRTLLRDPENSFTGDDVSLAKKNMVFQYLAEKVLQESDANLVAKLTHIEVANYGEITQLIGEIKLGAKCHKVYYDYTNDFLPRDIADNYEVVGSHGGGDIYGYYETEEIRIPVPFSSNMDNQQIESYIIS